MTTPSDSIIATAKDSMKDDGPISIVIVLKIKADKVARALELWQEQAADIDATEPKGNIRYSIFQRNDENEHVVVQEFASQAIMAAFFKKAKHEEISAKVYGEGLIEGEPEARYCRKIAGTKA